jgi:hypothetical protein
MGGLGYNTGKLVVNLLGVEMKDKLNKMVSALCRATSHDKISIYDFRDDVQIVKEAADFLQSMADMQEGTPPYEETMLKPYRDTPSAPWVPKTHVDWHIKQHALTKAELEESFTEIQELQDELRVKNNTIAEFMRELAEAKAEMLQIIARNEGLNSIIVGNIALKDSCVAYANAMEQDLISAEDQLTAAQQLARDLQQKVESMEEIDRAAQRRIAELERPHDTVGQYNPNYQPGMPAMEKLYGINQSKRPLLSDQPVMSRSQLDTIIELILALAEGQLFHVSARERFKAAKEAAIKSLVGP